MAIKKQNSKKKPKPKQTAVKPSPVKKYLHHFYWVFIAASVLLLVGSGGYYMGYSEAKTKYAKVIQTHKSEKRVLKKNIERLSNTTAKHEFAAHSKPPKAVVKKEKKVKGQKGKLAIIFDDVAFSGDVRQIKALKIPVTMSFLPPTKRHKSSAKLASKEPYYMVHLPMEAMNFHSPEKGTLLVTDSKDTVIKKVQEIKKLFPKVKYINNHTGSLFTSDAEAMNKLIFALRLEGIKFIDSRTTAKTVAQKVMKRYKMPYLSRDVFLDHEDNVEAIKLQIKKAVKCAQKYGKCIAICHPHKATLSALKASKDLLKSVHLVRIDGL